MAWPAQLQQDGKPTSRDNPQPVAGMAPTYKLIVLVDVAAHVAADVLFQPIELQHVTAKAGDTILIHNIYCMDPDDQGAALDIVFFDAVPTIAANNAAWATTDAEMLKSQEIVRISSGDWIDLGANRVASVTTLGKQIVTQETTSLWIAGLTQGTPTYVGGKLLLKIGFLRP